MNASSATPRPAHPSTRERLHAPRRSQRLPVDTGAPIGIFLATLTLITISAAFEPTALGAETERPRAARSVHLGYEGPDGLVFYNEMTVERSVPGSYFMAVGWNTGYFGIQELNDPTNKVVIFSVWDPTKGDNPGAVAKSNRVEVLHHDLDVRIKRFGGEGTGGQSMWPYGWKVGQTNRFCLVAHVEGGKTRYAAYFYLPAERRWKHLATFRTLTKGLALRGYYSFVEDFRRDFRSATQEREARFGNGWVRTVAGAWKPLVKARFTASGASWEAKETIDAGVREEQFYLRTGGNTRMTMRLRDSLIRAEQVGARPPQDLPE